MAQPPTQKTKHAALAVAALKVATLPLTVLVSIVLARALGPEDFGRYVFVVSLATVLAVPAGQGLSALLCREVAQAEQDGAYGLIRGAQRRAFTLLGLCVMLAILGGVGLMVLLSDTVEPLSFVTALVLFPCVALLGQMAGVLQGLKRPFASQFAPLALRPLLILLGALSLLWGLDGLTLRAALSVQVIATIGAAFVASLCVKTLMPRTVSRAPVQFDDRRWRGAFMPFALIAFTNIFNAEIGILVLGAFGQDAGAGALRVAVSAAQLLAFAMFVNNMVVSPHVAQMVKRDDLDAMRQLVRRASALTFGAALAMGVPLIVFVEPIVALTFGADFVALAATPIIILALGQVFAVALGPVDMLLSMAGKEAQALKGQILSVALVLGLALILVPSFGVIGAALAVALGTSVGRVIMFVLCWQIFHFRPSAL